MPHPDAARTSVEIDAALHEALRRKAATTEQSVSEIVGAAIREMLAEDAADLAAIEARADEPTQSFVAFADELRAEGAI
jgi:Arc/MetJ family transcription regulator